MSALDKANKIQWPAAAVLIALIAGSVCAAIFAPEDVRVALAVLLTALAGLLKVLK